MTLFKRFKDLSSSRKLALIIFVAVAVAILPVGRFVLQLAPAFFIEPTPTPPGMGGKGLAGVAPVPGAGVAWNASSFQPTDEVREAYDLLMEYRGAPLAWHPGLAGIAQAHSFDMAHRDYFALVSPEGIDLAQRAVSSTPDIRVGPPPISQIAWGVAEGTTDADNLAHAVCRSEQWVQILSDPSWLYVGIGFSAAQGGRWTLVVGK